MKLDTRWLDWQPSTAKFEKGPEPEQAKPAEVNFAVSAGSTSAQNQNFCPVGGTPELYEDGVANWVRGRCIFRDHCWGGLGALHKDYAVWCDRFGKEVPASLRTFKVILQGSGFVITDDGLVHGLVLVEDLRSMQRYKGSSK